MEEIGGVYLESILTSIKKLLGITEDYEHFDIDLIVDINASFARLTTLGVGSSEGFVISDKSNTWTQFSDDPVIQGLSKKFIFLDVKLAFDTSISQSVISSINEQKRETEWLLQDSMLKTNNNN